ncbi:cyanophycinase [Virgibacillus oceani]
MLTSTNSFGATEAATNPNQGSSLVLIGGKLGIGEHAQKIYKKIVELAGGKEGKIGVITSARTPYDWDCEKKGDSTDGGCNDPKAGNSKTVANNYIELLNKYGIHAEWIPVDLANVEIADNEKWAHRIAKGEFSGFFFGGGKQYQYIESFYRENDEGESTDSVVLEAIRDQFTSAGTMIAGTSAGAAVQSLDDMIIGGSSDRAIVEGAQKDYQSDSSVLTYIEEGGFGFFNYGIVDSHFSERGREGRAIRLASDTGNDMVFGLDETTALVVTDAHKPQAMMEIIGKSGVQILDLSQAITEEDDQGLWAIENVQGTYLTEGDRYIPQTDKVIFHSNKENISNKEDLSGNLILSKDIFSSAKRVKNEFINTACHLVDTFKLDMAYGYTRTSVPQYEVVFSKSEHTQAHFVNEDGKRKISYTGLQIDLHYAY